MVTRIISRHLTLHQIKLFLSSVYTIYSPIWTIKNEWIFLSLDIKGPFQCATNLLVLIDYGSRYLVIKSMKTINNDSTIKSLKIQFHYLAIQQKIITNNRPQLKSSEFTIYLSTHNIEHRIACHTSLWPMAKKRGSTEH